VVSIRHDGKVTPIPARMMVSLQFSPGGRFLAYDGIHIYNGMYRAASDAFTTSLMSVSANGYAGNNPLRLLAINAIETLALKPGAYPVELTGDRLVAVLGSYTLTGHRAGPATIGLPAAATR
jgi:hypothetical protein